MNLSTSPLSDVTTLAFIGFGEAVQAFVRRWQETSAEFGETAGNVDWQQFIGIKDLPSGSKGYGLRADAILAALAEKGADNG